MVGAIFLGMLFGSFFYGSLADNYGRKKILIITLIHDIIFSLLSAFAPNYAAFVALRVLAAIG